VLLRGVSRIVKTKVVLGSGSDSVVVSIARWRACRTAVRSYFALSREPFPIALGALTNNMSRFGFFS